MHAIYSISPGSRRRPTRSNRIFSPETSHVFSQLDDGTFHTDPHKLSRRDLEDIQQIGLNGKATNIKIIRLLREEESAQNETSSHELEPKMPTARDQSLINPLVIGIAGICVVLLIALVVVAVALRRRLSAQQSQNSTPVEANVQGVNVAQTRGVAV